MLPILPLILLLLFPHAIARVGVESGSAAALGRYELRRLCRSVESAVEATAAPRSASRIAPPLRPQIGSPRLQIADASFAGDRTRDGP